MTSIIYFQQNTALGACEEYIYLLMEGIDKQAFDVSFVCPKVSSLQSLVTKAEDSGIKVYQYPLDIGNLRMIFYLQSLFLRLKPSIIHFNDPCLNGIIAAKLVRAPVLVMTHHTPELSRSYNFKGKFLESIAIRHSGLNCIFTSDYDRDTGVKKDKIGQEKSFVIAYGLPPGKFSGEYDKKQICEEFGIEENCFLVGNVGRLSHQKGQVYLIEAAPLVIEKFKSVKFFFVGEGELEAELKDLVARKGLKEYFVFTGFRNDIPKLMSAFEMLVMPSLFEGLSFATIEASAMGIPIIATPVGGMRFSVINGKTGLLIPPENSMALGEAILWLLDHPQEAKDMGLAARKQFERLFTQDRMVKETEALYRDLAKK